MNFRPELAEAVIEGRKYVTRRVVSDNPRSPYHPDRAPKMVGKYVAVCPGRGKPQIGRVQIRAVERERAFAPGEVTLPEARREGFDSILAFLETWIAINDEAGPTDVWRFEFGRTTDSTPISPSPRQPSHRGDE